MRLLAVLLILTSQTAISDPACEPKPIVIAVIDTGFGHGMEGEGQTHLCKRGHKDFSDYDISSPPEKFHTIDRVPIDNHMHGTHIAGLIDKYASLGKENFCLVIVKYKDPLYFTVDQSHDMTASVKSIEYATNIKADYINYSSGGLGTTKDEVAAVKKYLDQGGKFIAAAGNEKSDLEKKPYYPAMDDARVTIVGNITDDGKIQKNSNYGDMVDRWEKGTRVEMFGVKMTGTSQAAAIATGKLVSESKNNCK